MTSKADKRILRLHAALSVADFRDAVGRLLEPEVPHHSWECVADPLRFDPNLLHFCTWPRGNAYSESEWRNLMRLSPFRLFFQTNLQAKSAWLTSLWPDHEAAKQNGFFREIMEPEGWRYGFGMGFRRKAELQAMIVIRRARQDGDFTEEERRYLKTVLYPHLHVAVMRVLKLEEERIQRTAFERLLGATESAFLLLDWETALLHCSQSARGLCSLWNQGKQEVRSLNGTPSFRLPSEIKQACLQLKFDYEKANQVPGPCELVDELEVFTSRDERLSARVLRLRPGRGCVGKPLFQVCLHRLLPGGGESPMARLELAEKPLSPAERDVVHHVCRGLTNQEIATRLNKSSETVKKQLRSVFRKLGVSSRGRLASLVTRSE